MGTVKYTGPVASFHCPTEATIRSLKVHFSPKQNLNGQTKPWPAGGGKNILNMDWFIATNSYISSTGATGTMAYYSYTDYLELAPNTYTISGVNNTVNSNLRIHSYDENKEWVKQLASKYLAEGASFSLTFTITSDDKYIRISAPAKTPENPYLQLEVGSTATAYVPYENICPIEGWDGVEVYNYIKTNVNTDIIPSEYKKVEYLESTGTQWIDTNYFPNNTTKAQCGCLLPQISNTGIFGCRDGNSVGVRDFDVIGYDNSSKYGLIVRFNSQNITKLEFTKNTYYDINIESGNLALNGVTFSSYEPTTFQCNIKTLTLFARNLPSGVACGALKIYYFKLYNTEIPILNLIPCRRKSDNKPGMYDTVSGEFFTNQGTGEFVCGPDVGQTTAYEFGVLGKNKFDKDSVTNNSYIRAGNTTEENPLGTIKENGTGYTLSSYIKVVPNTAYTIKYNISSLATVAGMVFFSEQSADSAISGVSLYSQTYVNSSTTREYYTFTTPNNCNYLRISTPPNCSNVQLEFGSTATTYEPYNPNHTVYGGWVDLVSGEVCEEYNYIDLGDKNWTYGSADVNFYTTSPSDAFDVARFNDNSCPFICTSYISSGAFVGDKIITMNNRQTGTSAVIRIRNTSYDDVSVFKSSLDGVLLYYKTKTPITYSLAPTQLQTFLGQNNVWSNADYVEVEYDLHETQTILERKAFILANQAKIKTATGAPATFTTTTHAPLKSAKVYFAPVQTGSGTPSPTNVRPILGWKQAGLVINRGKNLINEDALVPNTGIDASGNNRTWDTTKANDFLYLPPGDYILTGTYTGSDASANLRVHGYSHEQNWLKQITYQAKGPNQSYSIPFTMTADMPYMRFSANKDVTNIQLEEGSTESAYEAFSGRELSVNWGGDNGVIYGGYVDLVKGELVEQWHKIVADGVNVKTNSGYSNSNYFGAGIVYINPTGQTRNYTIAGIIQCDSLPINTNTPPFVYVPGAGKLYTVFYLFNTADYPDVTTTAERIAMTNAWLQEHPVTIVYKLTTPITYSLTPSQLSDFVRTNIVTPYSNSNVEVQYWTH